MPDTDSAHSGDDQEVSKPGRFGVPLTDEARAKGREVAAENRIRRENLAAEVRALEMFERAAPAMAKVLIDAAQGRSGFERLSPKERAAFAVKVLEYGVGRPRTTPDVPGPTEAAAQAQGLHFGVGSPQGDLLASVGADPGSEVEELASQRIERNVEIIPDGEGDEYVSPAERARDNSAGDGPLTPAEIGGTGA